MSKSLKGILPYLIVLAIICIVKFFVVTPVRVTGDSMLPTLENKDIMILDRMHYRFSSIERFDIVVIHHHDTNIIKRVIALPGETIKYIDQVLYINGEKVDEPFLHEKTLNFDVEGAIPDNCYYVLGDNRVNSKDSRVLGCISKKDILGKTSFTIFPFSKWGNKK